MSKQLEPPRYVLCVYLNTLKCQAVQRSNLELSLPLFDLCTLPSWWENHSSVYLFGDREQLEHLTCRHLRALDSVLNWLCPAHHHRTAGYQDTAMTCNMSPDSRRGSGGQVIIYSFTCLPPSLSPGFLISLSRVFCQLMMHNIHVLFEHAEIGCSIWGEGLTDHRQMPALFPRDLWQVHS